MREELETYPREIERETQVARDVVERLDGVLAALAERFGEILCGTDEVHA